jgi:integrase
MADGLMVAPTTEISNKLDELAQEAREIIAEGIPANTRRTYRSQWITFNAWCKQHNRVALPASSETLVLFLTDRSKEVKVSSLDVALAAITVAHREAGDKDWAATDLQGVRAFMRGLRRKKGRRTEKKEPFRLSDLVKGLPSGDALDCIQERALLLLGFFSAMRRSELVSLDVDSLQKVPTGYRITILNSKTDKEGNGQTITVPQLDSQTQYCPVRAVLSWLRVRPQTSDKALFLSTRTLLRMPDQHVWSVVRRAADRAGFDPRDFGAHSLRSGFATSAAESQAQERDIMRITRHRSERMVREYIHEAEMGANHPGRAIAQRVK